MFAIKSLVSEGGPPSFLAGYMSSMSMFYLMSSSTGSLATLFPSCKTWGFLGNKSGLGSLRLAGFLRLLGLALAGGMLSKKSEG